MKAVCWAETKESTKADPKVVQWVDQRGCHWAEPRAAPKDTLKAAPKESQRADYLVVRKAGQSAAQLVFGRAAKWGCYMAEQ